MTWVFNMLISSHMEMFKSKLFHFVVLGSPGLPSTAMISFSCSNSRVTMWLPTTDHSYTFFIWASIFSLRRIGLPSSPLCREGNAFILEHLLFHLGELVFAAGTSPTPCWTCWSSHSLEIISWQSLLSRSTQWGTSLCSVLSLWRPKEKQKLCKDVLKLAFSKKTF